MYKIVSVLLPPLEWCIATDEIVRYILTAKKFRDIGERAERIHYSA